MNIITVDRVRILVADVLVALRSLPDNSVDCVVTSPPYWGLRDYGVDGQIGMERTLKQHLIVMVGVFDEVLRVLKPSGTCFVNYGDCYATAPNGRPAADVGGDDRVFRDKPFSTVDAGMRLKPKDLCMIPNRLAIALQDAGWWVRSEIIWGKPNAMPDSSGRYRPAVAHEKIFLLTKSDQPEFWVARDTGEISQDPDMTERVGLITAPDRLGSRWTGLGHYYDAEAVRVGRASDEDAITYRGGAYCGGQAKRTAKGNRKVPSGWDQGDGGHGSFHRQGRANDKQRGHGRRHAGMNDRWDAMSKEQQQASGRFLRNYEPPGPVVWNMATAAFPGAHFATFPPELAERCIRAGCPAGGTVLDPFGGSGTTAMVASALNRDAILIELNPEYAEIARKRCAGEPIPRVGADTGSDNGQADLFGEAA